MRWFTFVSLTLSALAAAGTASGKESKLQRCSVKESPSTCPKDSYCKASKNSYSHCAKKLDGGKTCDKDAACVSDLCFIVKGPRGKRVCASLPLSNYPLGAQCTQSKQCASTFCDKGYCKKPVAGGEKCPKEAGCAELKKGAHCLKKSESFVVYDAAGKSHKKNLSAGKCSYVTNLGEGMNCSSDANCYSKKFTCSKKTKKCTAIVKPPTNKLPYQEKCSKDSACSSSKCVEGKCGCTSGSSDCDSNHYCTDIATCEQKHSLGDICTTDDACRSGTCLPGNIGPKRANSKVCSCANDSACDSTQFCDTANTHQCVDKRSYSSNCKGANQCSSGVCLGTTCGCSSTSQCSGTDICDATSHTCTPVAPTDLPYLQSCSADSECASGRCLNAQCGCDASGSDCDEDTEFCSDLPTCQAKSSYGQSCTSGLTCLDNTCVVSGIYRRGQTSYTKTCGCVDDGPCENGTYCDTDHLCHEPRSYGQSCPRNSLCLSGVCQDNGTCGCSLNSQCSGTQICDTNTHNCVAPTNLSYGDPCSAASECASGNCQSQHCGCSVGSADCGTGDVFCNASSVCQFKTEYGYSCSNSGECLSGLCGSDFNCGCVTQADCYGGINHGLAGPDNGFYCAGNGNCYQDT